LPVLKPLEEKRDVCPALVRMAVQVIAELMQDCPEAVDKYPAP
jgi:hypothetical protein